VIATIVLGAIIVVLGLWAQVGAAILLPYRRAAS
jgi:hypothetical protein